MKQVIMIAAVALFFVFAAKGQAIATAKVPAAVKASFKKKYPGIAGKWEKEDGNYEVNFQQHGNHMSAVIKADGTVTETETDIKATELPKNVLSYLKEHYKGKAIKEGAIITKEDGTINY